MLATGFLARYEPPYENLAGLFHGGK